MRNRRTVAVSACLLGCNCRYDGKNNANSSVIEITEGCAVIPICPEMEGGLSCPRTPAEIVGDSVITKDGKDVTDSFRKGAWKCLEKILEEKADFAILSSLSPSCGVNEIYDGSFSHTKVNDSGVLASLLKEKGIPVIDSFTIRHSEEEDFPRIMQLYSEARVTMSKPGKPFLMSVSIQVICPW